MKNLPDTTLVLVLSHKRYYKHNVANLQGCQQFTKSDRHNPNAVEKSPTTLSSEVAAHG